jgi:hypothetical protein
MTVTVNNNKKPLVVPLKPPTTDEYTPAQRRVADRGIAKGLQDIRKGRIHGPFEIANEAIVHLRAHAIRRKKAAAHVSAG